MTYNPDDVAEELARYDEEFAAAPIPETSGASERIPDGTYQASIKNASVKYSKAKPGKPAKLMLEWWLKILGPTHAGAEIPRWNHFDSAEKLGWLKKDLAICGLTLGRLAALEAALVELLDKRLEITLRTNGQYQNVYFNRLITSANPDEPPPAGDTPF